jgi:hypothetical protein
MQSGCRNAPMSIDSEEAEENSVWGELSGVDTRTRRADARNLADHVRRTR